MNTKKMLSKEICSIFEGEINEEIVAEKIDQFLRHGTMYLLIELIILKREIKSLKKELHQKEEKHQNSFHSVLVS
jgi:hypothetical protein